METQNPNLPADKQDIDNIKDTQQYVDYLNFGVKEGYIDEDEATEIIAKGQWDKVERMMDMADAYDPTEDMTPEEFEKFKNEELYGNEGSEDDVIEEEK